MRTRGSPSLAALVTSMSLACGVEPGGSRVEALPAPAGAGCYGHTFLGDRPDEGNPGWHQEAQGLAHDADHWFAAQNVRACVVPQGHSLCHVVNSPEGCIVPEAACIVAGVPDSCATRRQGLLWRIDVTHDLADEGASGVATPSAAICENGYDHFGGPVFHAHAGTGFVLVPLEGNGPAVAAFSSDPGVGMIDWSTLQPDLSGQASAAWVAVDGLGFLWMGNHAETHLNRYTVDWDALRDQGHLAITFRDHIPLLDEAGQPLALDSWEQGGVFAEDPTLPYPLLYLVNGDDSNDCDCGIHVFEVRDIVTGEPCGPGPGSCAARRVDRSTNGSGQFNYAYDPGFPTYEEPEGLTFWDLDADSRAPGVSGQLHVVMLDNDSPVVFQGDDDVYVKHYRLLTDAVPPAITCPQDAVVECTGQNGIQAGDAQLAAFFAGVSASDLCDPQVSIASDASGLFPLGTTPVSFTATDDFGNTSTCLAAVTVLDTAEPAILVSLDPEVLWPPNHKLVEITARVTVSDVCDPAPSFVLASIASSEPDDGAGDGHTSDDIQGAAVGTADTSFLLRAERSGPGPGRVYTVQFTASDGSGNASSGAAVVLVPHP